MPSARSKAFFASFLWPLGQKEWRLAGRDTPVLPLAFQNKKEQQSKFCCSHDEVGKSKVGPKSHIPELAR
jgi:hypothetical protein